MTGIFLQIINMSITASYGILAVMLLRLIINKAPKWITVALWGVASLRLIFPFSIESVLSLIPNAMPVSPSIMTDKTPEINTGIPPINNTLIPVIGEYLTPNHGDSANPLQVWIPILTMIWLVGIATLLLYTIVSYLKISRRVETAVLYEDNIYRSEKISSPFVFGIIKPRIYLPFDMNEKDISHVLAHERAHISRMDHIWKLLGYLLITVYWFNPLVWFGYILLCRDIELACDEKVIKEMGEDERADYSEALLACSINGSMISACPLAFGELSVKDRVKRVLNYKKPAVWLIAVAVIACVSVAVCFLTNPKIIKGDDPDINEPSVKMYTYGTKDGTPELVYHDPVFSWVDSFYPGICIVGDTLYDLKSGNQLGILSEMELNADNLDAKLRGWLPDHQGLGEKIRQNALASYEVELTNVTRGVDLYYVIIQNDGTAILVYGHYADGEKTDYLRWIFNIGK